MDIGYLIKYIYSIRNFFLTIYYKLMPNHQKVVQNVQSFFSEKLVQISLVSGVLFYVVANPAIFNMVEKVLKQVLGVVGFNVNLKGENLLVFHSLVFAVLMGLTVKYIFQPLMVAWQNENNKASYLEGVLEGYGNKDDYREKP